MTVAPVTCVPCPRPDCRGAIMLTEEPVCSLCARAPDAKPLNSYDLREGYHARGQYKNSPTKWSRHKRPCP